MSQPPIPTAPARGLYELQRELNKQLTILLVSHNLKHGRIIRQPYLSASIAAPTLHCLEEVKTKRRRQIGRICITPPIAPVSSNLKPADMLFGKNISDRPARRKENHIF